MHKLRVLAVFLAVSLPMSRVLLPQAFAESVQILCNPEAPEGQCAGSRCGCTLDTLEVTFDGLSQSVLEMIPFEVGATIETTAILDAKSSSIQGWSYAVEHDEEILALEGVSIDGTAAEPARDGGFVVADMSDVERCPHRDRTCESALPGGGYITAVILSFTREMVLPLGRNAVCRARYSTRRDPGPPGTRIRIVHEKLRKRRSPPVAVNITTGGESRLPSRLVDGWIGSTPDPLFEDCSNKVDDDGDGLADCSDPECDQALACVPPEEICVGGLDEDLDGLIDCDDPACASVFPCKPPVEERPPVEETPPAEDCDNLRDDDRDGATDCSDTDCDDDARCVPRPEECANGRDDDFDGRTDCADLECEGLPACAPRPEVCGNGFDDDRDGEVDCSDLDCARDSFCLVNPREGCCGGVREICDNCQDDDGNGKADCDDPRCASAAPCSASDPDCPDYALYFGPSAGVEEHAIQCGQLSICLRNAAPVSSFRVAVRRLDLPERSQYQFALDLGEAGEVKPLGRNEAWGPPGDELLQIERGAALAGLKGSDYLAVDLAPAHGEAGFTVEYAADPDGSSGDRVIPPSGPAGSCRAHEILKVRVGRRSVDFRRGDVDGSGRISVADGIALLQILFSRAAPKFDCDDLLDLNDDGGVSVPDGIWVLQYVFLRGRAPPGPYPLCGADKTPERAPIHCAESNCGG